VALWLQPVQQTLQFGQVNLILMLIIVADFSLPAGAWPKGMGIGLAAGFKLTPLIFIPYLVLTRQFRMAGTAIVTFAATIAASLVLLPGLSRQFWLGGLFLDSGRTGNIAYVGNQSLNGALERLMGDAQTAHPYWVAASVAVGIFGLLIAAWWARHGHEMAGVLLCALTGLLISPISWSHHWVWSALALAVAADAVVRAAVPLPWWARSPTGTARPTTQGRRPGWRWWAFWPTVTALITLFYMLPQSLIPASVVQGIGARGAQLLTGNLYVAGGLALLCLAGLLLIARKVPPGGDLQQPGDFGPQHQAQPQRPFRRVPRTGQARQSSRLSLRN
jgi:alpha-1,2-mannosyltransferase